MQYVVKREPDGGLRAYTIVGDLIEPWSATYAYGEFAALDLLGSFPDAHYAHSAGCACRNCELNKGGMPVMKFVLGSETKAKLEEELNKALPNQRSLYRSLQNAVRQNSIFSFAEQAVLSEFVKVWANEECGVDAFVSPLTPQKVQAFLADFGVIPEEDNDGSGSAELVLAFDRHPSGGSERAIAPLSVETLRLLQQAFDDQNHLIQHIDEIEERLGSDEGIMIDEGAMEIVRSFIEESTEKGRHIAGLLRQAIDQCTLN